MKLTTPTIDEVREMPLSEIHGKTRTGATNAVRFQIVPVDDEHASEVIVADVMGGRQIIRACDSGQWDQFMHRELCAQTPTMS